MGRADRDKWNARYREGAYATRTHPSALLAEWLPKLAIGNARPRAVDIGCGAGRNALYLGGLGWQVDALDISQVALERLATAATAQHIPITCVQTDLEDPPSLPSVLRTEDSYDLMIMMRYTNLPLIQRLKPVLKTGGCLIVEVHLETDADVVGPRNPLFRVASGALRQAAGELNVIAYREAMVDEPDGRLAALAQLVATIGEPSVPAPADAAA